MDGVDLNLITDFLGKAANHQMTQFGVAFMMAAWVHSGRVKKEFTKITEAINNLGIALRSDLNNHEARIKELEFIHRGNNGTGQETN